MTIKLAVLIAVVSAISALSGCAAFSAEAPSGSGDCAKAQVQCGSPEEIPVGRGGVRSG